MEDQKAIHTLAAFMESGIYRFHNLNSIFIDPVRVLNRSYSRFRVSPTAYYPRFFDLEQESKESGVCSDFRKRKRKKKKPRSLNDKERAAERRHQEARPLLLKAHEYFLNDPSLLRVVSSLNIEFGFSRDCRELPPSQSQLSFVELSQFWQAPLYEITLKLRFEQPDEGGGSPLKECTEQSVLPIFNNLVVNDKADDAEAEFLDNHYVLPQKSCFYMSDMGDVRHLLPDESNCGFNLIVIDPPWENGSASQKQMYPTLPNRHFLGLPIKMLCHTEGALIALWVTNREKLRCFVEKELFHAWGVRYLSTYYWLKVKADGSLVCDLDLLHHKPYECLLLGYVDGEESQKSEKFKKILPDDLVMISIPGDYSRKPPVGEQKIQTAERDQRAAEGNYGVSEVVERFGTNIVIINLFVLIYWLSQVQKKERKVIDLHSAFNLHFFHFGPPREKILSSRL